MGTLLDLLISEAEILDLELKKASLEGHGTPQEVADRRESYIHQILAKYFPYPYRIAKGNIRDSYGKDSMSIDCIILNPCHPYTISNDNHFSIILADGVDAAIEVKPILQGEELYRGLNQLISVKKLRRCTTQLNENRLSEKDKEHKKTIPSIIFSTSTYADIKTLIEKIIEFYEANKTPQIEQFDLIVINNQYVIINCKQFGYKLFNYEGMLIIEPKEKTLALFILLLNKFPGSAPKISENILTHYLKIDEIKNEYITFPSLNDRLLKLKGDK